MVLVNHSTAANYQLSMTIDNSTGTGVGNQDLFPASAASQFRNYCIASKSR
jgi:hypothetical protein